MRVISGKFKGKNLKQFDIESTRPTTDLVKGAVFNALNKKNENSIFLDLFAGTGAMGIEAISRGAKKTYFVDKNKACCELVKTNLKLLDINNCEIFKGGYLDALLFFSKQKIKFDIIYIDPPYESLFAEEAIKLIYKLNLLNEDGLILWEHDKTKLNIVNALDEKFIKKYGIKYITKINNENLKIIYNCINMQLYE